MKKRIKNKVSKYSSKTFKMKYQLFCNQCSRFRRRFMKVGEIKGIPIIICVPCVEKMRRGQKQEPYKDNDHEKTNVS